MSESDQEQQLLDAVDRIQLTLERIQGVSTLAGYYAEIEVGDPDLAKAIYLCGGLARELDEYIGDWWHDQRKKQKKRRKKRSKQPASRTGRHSNPTPLNRRAHLGDEA